MSKAKSGPLNFLQQHEAKIHVAMAMVWLLLTIPTILFWSESILWILMISIYANIGAHIAAYEGAKDDTQIDYLIDQVKQLRQTVEDHHNQ